MCCIAVLFYSCLDLQGLQLRITVQCKYFLVLLYGDILRLV